MSTTPADSLASLGERMSRSLSFAGLSAAQMADQLGTTLPTVESWLAGRSAPRLPHLMVWARACGVPFEWLTDTENDR